MRELTAPLLFVSLCALVGCSDGGGSVLAYRAVDEAARSAALEAIAKKCDEIAASGKDKAAQNEAIAEHVRTYPDIAFASTSVDGVVALFYDGQPIIILNNIELGASGSPPPPPPDEGRRGFSLPWGKTARLMNGFPPGGGLHGFPPDPSPDLAAILSKKGYTPKPTGASVEDFRSVAGDAILHIRTHGGGGEVLDKDGKRVQTVDASGKPKTKEDGTPEYATLFGLWTTDVADATTIEKHKDDLVAQRLVRMHEVIYPRAFGGEDYKAWHLGITAGFVTKYWSHLAMDAYIHVSACSTAGSGVGNQAFREAIQDKAVTTVYLGWTAPAVVGHMDRAAKYLMDRLAGANVLDTAEDPKEDPPQRPFDLQSLLGTLGTRGVSAGAQLQAFPDASVSTDTYVLAPSIATAQVWDSEDTLQLTGLFGNATTTNTTVTVGGSACAVQPGGGTRGLICKLDKTAKGEILATVDGRESNRVKLSSWRGKLTYAVESDVPGLSQVWTVDLHLRGDVGDYRDKPGKPPVAHKKVISMAKDAKATVVAGGNVMTSECNVTWTPKTFNVEMWGTPSLMTAGYFLIFTGVVDEGDPGKLWFELVGKADPCYGRSVQKSGSGNCSALGATGHCLLPAANELITTAADPYHVGLIGRFKTPAALSANGTIAKGDVPLAPTLCCGGETGIPWDYTQRLSWDAMTPEGGTEPDRAKDER